MPGMMDTVLNLGLNDKSVEGLANATGNERFAYDSYRRLINMFGDVVDGRRSRALRAAFDTIKKKYKAKLDTDVPTEGLEEVGDALQGGLPEARRRADFPQDPLEQLEGVDRSRLQELDGQARHHVSPDRRHPRPARHRRQRAVDGLRQHGR